MSTKINLEGYPAPPPRTWQVAMRHTDLAATGGRAAVRYSFDDAHRCWADLHPARCIINAADQWRKHSSSELDVRLLSETGPMRETRRAYFVMCAGVRACRRRNSQTVERGLTLSMCRVGRVADMDLRASTCQLRDFHSALMDISYLQSTCRCVDNKLIRYRVRLGKATNDVPCRTSPARC